MDLYQLHGGTIEDPIDETIEAFEELKQEGLIRYYGISSIRPNVIREYVNRASLISIMMQYSLFDRRPEEEMLDLLNKNDISVVTRGSLAKGLLSNQAEQKLRNKATDGYLTYSVDELTHTIEQLKTKDLINQSLLTTSLRYVLKHPAVASVVAGASSLEQLETNVAALEQGYVITDTLYKNLQSTTKANTYVKHR
ncbi:aldo/keto reductase [Paraliobacillus ryukyuensis]|uniref:aldo/keto reductase n=1 Tax=Paraliobacillus ryukyuensis TaxID=200904 RepID=UPI0009A5EA04